MKNREVLRAAAVVMTAAVCIIGCNGKDSQKPSMVEYEFEDSNYAYNLEDADPPQDITQKRDGVNYRVIDDRISYYSTTIGEDKECGVLLPDGYSENRQYPVVYILHGNNGDHYDWNRDDSYLKTMTGNMVADGEAVPAIIVMVDMWTAPKAEKENKTIETQLNAYDEFYKDLENDLMPYINSHYSVAKGRSANAIIGTSQGGTESLVSGFKMLDKIGFISALAPCTGVIPFDAYGESPWNTPVLDDFAINGPNETPYYIQLVVGSEDPWCFESTKYYDQVMQEEDIEHTMTVVSGLGHEDKLWQYGIYNFFRKIFK